ncbi:hypothetical protein RI129_000359 [Pyrocoelia pectoralis]|uniref:Ankyrin repeat, SAM and basic leucine zipper domain-containing protein 1 n=1 Tax=Pyrocoelia pectoralis TaxID=417401 RepID=A0AAN7VI50_9COLE
MDYDDFDDFEDFLSDDSDVSINMNDPAREPPEITHEQKLQNFFFYIIRGNLLGICELLDSGIEINSELQDRWKPIVLAASIGNQEVVHELIIRGANVNEHRDHTTVLMYVCNCLEKNSPFEKCYEIVLELLENGAEVNITNRRKETALMFASGIGNVKIVEKLLTCCNSSAEDQRGWNALFWAVDSNRVEIVKILLNAGLEYEKRDVCGNTPLSLAKIHEYIEIIDLLSNDTVDPLIVTLKNSYDLEDFLEGSERPQFVPDIFTMLYGIRCENLQTLFSDTNLLSFLSSTDDSLLKLGVTMPYQRKRILMGLNKFHKHLFKKKSLPIVPRDALYTTIDFSHALLTAIRHLTVMEANLVYILQSKDNFRNDVAESVIGIRKKFNMLKRAAKNLDTLTQQWDNNNKSVDLITRQRPWLKWMKFTSFTIILIGSVFLLKPIRFS